MRRRGAALLIVCALVEVGCLPRAGASISPNEPADEEGETVPPLRRLE